MAASTNLAFHLALDVPRLPGRCPALRQTRRLPLRRLGSLFSKDKEDGDLVDFAFNLKQAAFLGLECGVQEFVSRCADQDASAQGQEVGIGESFVIALEAGGGIDDVANNGVFKAFSAADTACSDLAGVNAVGPWRERTSSPLSRRRPVVRAWYGGWARRREPVRHRRRIV